MATKYIIWSNHSLNYEDWRDDLEEYYPDLDDDERESLMYEINNEYLDDERAKLNISLGEPILVIADLGLWDGRCSGYREISSGKISDCLYSGCVYATWYVDKLGDFKCEGIHHDGTNHYLYRVWKPEASETARENLMEKLYYGTATRRDITRLTRAIGGEIKKVYGWR